MNNSILEKLLEFNIPDLIDQDTFFNYIYDIYDTIEMISYYDIVLYVFDLKIFEEISQFTFRYNRNIVIQLIRKNKLKQLGY